MPMEGSSEEYEKLALSALKKAASANSDPTYHNNRAAIFASLAMAAASSEMAVSLTTMSNPEGSSAPAAGTGVTRPAAAAAPTASPAAGPDGVAGNGSTPGTAIVPRPAG